ncbi:hypothetical protein UlMin_040706 [Ulmus minor]
MNKHHLGFRGSGIFTRFLVVFHLLVLSLPVESQSTDDGKAIAALSKSIGQNTLGWSGSNFCNWNKVKCDNSGRVTKIQIGNQNLAGSIAPEISQLSALEQLEFQNNQLTGPFPNLAGLGSLRVLLAHTNNFSSIPVNFFTSLSSLENIKISYNPFSEWTIPDNVRSLTQLKYFSANKVNLIGKIPDFFGNGFASLTDLHLGMNGFEGELPASFVSSSIQTLWLNGNNLTGSIEVLHGMTGLTEVWLHGNKFTGPIPDVSNLTQLKAFSLRDNQFTGIVPSSLTSLPSLSVVNFTNNLLQGPTPKFPDGVIADMRTGSNSFCQDQAGVDCDLRVDVLLSVVEPLGYPATFADDWKGTDPCANWKGISCGGRDITVVNFQKMGLVGTISSNFSKLPALKKLLLSGNLLTGTIPNELTTLSQLQELDVSSNTLHGKVPSFSKNVIVKTDGNPDIGKDVPPPTSTPGSPGSDPDSGSSGGGGKKSKTGMVVGVVVGVVVGSVGGLLVIGAFAFCLVGKKRKHSGRVQSPNTMVLHPRHSGDQEAVKITVANSRTNGSGSEAYSPSSSGGTDMHVVEAGNMVISIQVLRSVTNNFSEENILGQGGFGIVYKGELHDGTKIAVKRMGASVMADKGLTEFKSEIAVLTKVRHRHLVALLGYCLDGNEKLLVYEYMPQGTLSRHLFNWRDEGLKPLEWTRRLTIALDVARAVEYLHSLAHQSFIHRDLKPSNILLGDDMRAKVADFGLVRLAPDGKASFETRVAGTLGYLAPEYAETGKISTKVDVYSFGVILTELVTGRKSIDGNQAEESLHLVTWFRRTLSSKEGFRKAIDPIIDVNEETLPSISTVAELAGHCTARVRYQRPEIGHAVNVLSSLVEFWKPVEAEDGDADADDVYGINLRFFSL